MATAQTQERVGLDSSRNPLNHEGILELVLSFLGGQGLYARTVSKSWKACYEQLVHSKGSSRRHVHSSECTSYAAAFASPARLLWAHDCNWDLRYYVEAHDISSFINGDILQECAGRYADIATLQTAHQRGLAWTPLIVRSAALSGSLPKLVWLCDEQHCPLPADIVEAAAEGGSVEMLQWLKQKGFKVSTRTTTSAARRLHNIPVLQFLLNEGCEWHDRICNAAAEAGDLEQLKWLHQHGATLHREALEYAVRSGVVW